MTAFVLKNNDLAISRNAFVLTENNSDREIEQRVRSTLGFFLGEWFLDLTLGIPWIQGIFVKGVDPTIAESVLKDAIVGVEGVTGLNRFDPIIFDTATREMTVTFEVLTVNYTNLAVEFRR